MIPSLVFITTFLLPFTLAVVRDVQVGEAGGAMTFDPWFLHAQPSDEVNFIFDTPHTTWSLTQSSYQAPCDPLTNGTTSGNISVPASATKKTFPTFTYRIPSSEPLWFFCGPQDLCTKGVVFSINPPDEQSYYLFRAQAMGRLDTNPSVNAAPSPTASTTTVTPDFPSYTAAVGNSVATKVDNRGSRVLSNKFMALLLVSVSIVL